jgi:hypothetical protein
MDDVLRLTEGVGASRWDFAALSHALDRATAGGPAAPTTTAAALLLCARGSARGLAQLITGARTRTPHGGSVGTAQCSCGTGALHCTLRCCVRALGAHCAPSGGGGGVGVRGPPPPSCNGPPSAPAVGVRGFSRAVAGVLLRHLGCQRNAMKRCPRGVGPRGARIARRKPRAGVVWLLCQDPPPSSPSSLRILAPCRNPCCGADANIDLR